MANKNLYVESFIAERLWPGYAQFYLCFKHAVRALLANIEVGEIVEDYMPECCFCSKKETIESIRDRIRNARFRV